MGPRIDQASRIIRAAPSHVYQAFRSAAALESWLPPKGMTGSVLSFSFDEGRGYRMRLTYDEPGRSDEPGRPRGKTSAGSDEVDVRFVRLEENRRIVQVVDFDSEDPAFAGSMTMTWSFIAVREGTDVRVRCENVPSGIRPEDHAAGLSASLENLAVYTE